MDNKIISSILAKVQVFIYIFADILVRRPCRLRLGGDGVAGAVVARSLRAALDEPPICTAVDRRATVRPEGDGTAGGAPGPAGWTYSTAARRRFSD